MPVRCKVGMWDVRRRCVPSPGYCGHLFTVYRALLSTDGRNMQYIERDETEHFHTLHEFPDRLTKKVTLLKYFRNYMSQHLVKVEID